MGVSARVEYACVAMLELASRYGTGKPVRVREIAETHGVSSRFLAQVLLQLKSAGLVTSARGAAGGYIMIQEPASVSLGQVVAVVDSGGENQVAQTTDGNGSPVNEALSSAWLEGERAKRERLDGITLADLVKRVGEQNKQMYYI
jgi:Rrf2 family protein